MAIKINLYTCDINFRRFKCDRSLGVFSAFLTHNFFKKFQAHVFAKINTYHFYKFENSPEIPKKYVHSLKFLK
jgi:hypothetical protein